MKSTKKPVWGIRAFIALSALLSLVPAGCGSGPEVSEEATAAANAAGAQPEDFDVKLNDAASGVIITKYRGKAAAVTIPADFEGFPTVGIGTEAFIKNTSLKSLELPAGIESIGYEAFKECTSLTSITLPGNLKSIGYRAFYGCSSLKSLDLPAGLESIDDSAFSGCKSLTSLVLPDTVSQIPWSAFSGSGLESITLPESLKSIGAYAFTGCSSLKSLDLPAGIESIGDGAFSGCRSLTSITIPGQVREIKDGTFVDCVSLAEITFMGNINTPYSYINFPFRGCGNLTTVNIAPEVTTLEVYFPSYSKLTLKSKAALQKIGYKP